MVQPVYTIITSDHLDLLKFPKGRRHCRPVGLEPSSPELILEICIKPASDEGDEFYENLRRLPFASGYPHGLVPKIRLITLEELLVLIPGLVYGNRFLSIHFCGSYYREVAAVPELLLYYIALFFVHQEHTVSIRTADIIANRVYSVYRPDTDYTEDLSEDFLSIKILP